MATGIENEAVSFGENIDRSLYEETMIETVNQMKRQGKGVYDLQQARNEMSQEKDKYIFITIYMLHASIVICDKELFDTLFFEPVWGQMIEGSLLRIKDSEVTKRMMETIPLQQYHVTLDDCGRYLLARNMFYVPWLMKSRSFFVGETGMAYLYLQMLSLQVLPSRYRLILDDCLEFAKRFAREVAIRELGVRETEVQVLFRTLKVSEGMTGTVEQSSRNNPNSGLTGAISYFMSFKWERFVVLVVVTIVSVMLAYYLMK